MACDYWSLWIMRHEYAVFGAYSLHIRIFGAVCDRDEGGDFPAPSAHDAYSGILPASLYAWLEAPRAAQAGGDGGGLNAEGLRQIHEAKKLLGGRVGSKPEE